MDLGRGKMCISGMRQGVWEQVLRGGEGSNSLYLSPSSLCSDDLRAPGFGKSSFRGEKESTDVWKCPLATENLQFTDDICRII